MFDGRHVFASPASKISFAHLHPKQCCIATPGLEPETSRGCSTTKRRAFLVYCNHVQQVHSTWYTILYGFATACRLLLLVNTTCLLLVTQRWKCHSVMDSVARCAVTQRFDVVMLIAIKVFSNVSDRWVAQICLVHCCRRFRKLGNSACKFKQVDAQNVANHAGMVNQLCLNICFAAGQNWEYPNQSKTLSCGVESLTESS